MRAYVPDDAPAAAVDGLRDEPHETMPPPPYTRSMPLDTMHCMRPPPTASTHQKLAQSFYLYYEKLITLLIFSQLLLFACSTCCIFPPFKTQLKLIQQRPRSLVLKMACSVSFFSRNSVFLSQQFSRNRVFLPVSAKFQTSERGRSG